MKQLQHYVTKQATGFILVACTPDRATNLVFWGHHPTQVRTSLNISTFESPQTITAIRNYHRYSRRLTTTVRQLITTPFVHSDDVATSLTCHSYALKR
jgi:hypothetical protein